jgi:diguanylate cyclase (GGDEF)-like protein
MVLVIAFSGGLGLESAKTIPFFLFTLIVWTSAHGTKPLFKNLEVTPVDLLDLALLPSITHIALLYTGGVQSPYRALHIPLVVANSLKKGRWRGLTSTLLSLGSISIVGFQALGSIGSWTTDSNFTIGLVYVLTFYLANRFRTTETSLKRQLVQKATTDDLTELYNHAYADRYLDRKLGSAEDRVYLLMLDLDNFKSLNDTLGHVEGDRLLREIGASMKGLVRGGDIVARYGGDEFLVIPERVNNEEQARALGERVRRSIEQTCDEFVIEKGFPHLSRALTASCGIARTSQLVKDKDSLIRAADEALYMAKAQGKNRAVVAG